VVGGWDNLKVNLEKIESAQHHPLAKFEKNKLLKQDV
jgi:hypothetical protein